MWLQLQIRGRTYLNVQHMHMHLQPCRSESQERVTGATFSARIYQIFRSGKELLSSHTCQGHSSVGMMHLWLSRRAVLLPSENGTI